MDVIVIGGGMAGIATAHALHGRGHRVRVVERQGTVAQAATFGQNAAALPSPLDVWFGPGMVDCRRPTLFGRRAPTVLSGGADRAARGFARRLAVTADPAVFAGQYTHLQALARLSDTLLDALAETHTGDFELRAGIVHLFDTPEDLAAAAPAIELLKTHGIAHRRLDSGEAERVERALSPAAATAGGILLPQARSGNCALLTKQLKTILETDGVEFLCGRRALAVRLHDDGASLDLAPVSTGLHARDADRLDADAIVLAAGVGTPGLLKRSGVGDALSAVHTHALSAPIVQHEIAPGLPTIVDTARRIALTRFNHRVRITGASHLRGLARVADRQVARHSRTGMDQLGEALHRWLPGIVKLSSAHAWDGVKLLSADGLPWVGPSAHPRLWINCAHGPAGWALALGAAHLLADLLDGKPPALPAESVAALAPARAPIAA